VNVSLYHRSFTVVLMLACFSFTLQGACESNGCNSELSLRLISSTSWTPGDHRTGSEGYRAVIRHKEGFLAAGSGGRIDWISVSGNITRSEDVPGEVFNCILLFDQSVYIAGERGTMLLLSEDGTVHKIPSGTRKNINALAAFNGTMIAGADEGTLVLHELNGLFHEVDLPLKGNIVSLSARASACFGVTDEGEIIHSTDGMSWDIFDFNHTYSGFYDSCCFTKILAAENRIVVAGVNKEGLPVMYYSRLGGVWTERDLDYTDDQGRPGFLTDVPNDIYYDEQQDQTFLVCNDGKLILLPSCSQCNRLKITSSNNLEGIACNENTILIAGENYFVKTINLR
jgi:hypothetical protein